MIKMNVFIMMVEFTIGTNTNIIEINITHGYKSSFI